MTQMSVSDICDQAGIEERRLYALRLHQVHVNYYVADSILTKLNGPPLVTLYPDAA